MLIVPEACLLLVSVVLVWSAAVPQHRRGGFAVGVGLWRPQRSVADNSVAGLETGAVVRAICGVALVPASGYLLSRLITPRVHSSCNEHLDSSAMRLSWKCVSFSKYTTMPVLPLR